MSSVAADRHPRLLIVITLAEVGGAQSHVAALLPALTREFDVTVAAHGAGPLRDAAASAGAQYVALHHVRRALNPWRDALGLIEIVRLMRRLRPHIVHTHSSKAGILGRLGAAVTRVPVRLFTAHSWAFAAYNGLLASLYLWSDRLIAPFTTTVVCVNERDRTDGLRLGTCRADRTVVIHNAVDVHAAPRAALLGTPPVIVSVGRLKSPKDPLTLVHALGRLEPGSFRAALVGDGPDRPQLAAAIHCAGLDGSVELLGERFDVPAVLASADVFVLSSLSEGLPISVLEAMAAGLPVIASLVGGVPEMVVHGETGFLVAPNDPAALGDALRPLVGDADLRRRLGAAGRERALSLFDLPRFRDAHLALYRDLLSRRTAQRPTPPSGLSAVVRQDHGA